MSDSGEKKDDDVGLSQVFDYTDAVELFEPQGLYLKPIAKLNISVQLPQMKVAGKSISNWEVMEKLKKMIRPDTFLILKVVKSTLEFVRFEGEIESKTKLMNVIGRLDGKTIKLTGFAESLKVRACESKMAFPIRHDWESYFRDAKHMNEMKPGERPDTIHFRELPSRWFVNRKDEDTYDLKNLPSEFMLRKVFESFGEVRAVDIPMLDPYRKEMTHKAGSINTFNFGNDLQFDGFVQFKEYISFVKAMAALRGMKLMFKDGEKVVTATLKVDFDKAKHLSDKSIKRRRIEREKLIQLEQEREERVKAEREAEEAKRLEEERVKEAFTRAQVKRKEMKKKKREDRRREREQKRRQKRLEKKRREEEKLMAFKIATEERKILIAQRKLETIRLLSELFNRIKVVKQQEELERRERELEEERKRQVELQKRIKLEQEKKKIDSERKKREQLERQERDLRDRILKNLKTMEERKAEKLREQLRRKIAGKSRLRSTVNKRR